MDLLQQVIQKITYPFFMRYDGKGDAIKYLKYFDYVDGMNREDLLNSQRGRLRDILIHAYENSDYYKQLFDGVGLDVQSDDFVSDFHRLPLLTKKVVKENYDDLIAKNIPESDVTEASTGGSTGVPMYFLRDKECLYLRRGQELFFDSWMGYKIGKKVGYFVAGSHFDGRISRLKYKIHFVKQNHLKVAPVKTISCTGETLYKQQRAMFEEVFNAEVFEKVGTRESGVFACECKEHKGLHIFTEGVYLELIKQDGSHAQAGEMGKVVITDLFNKAMPLIRYEIGDMAVSGGDELCKCGSSLPLIKNYLGRTRDIILDSNGNPRPGYLFVEIIKDLNLNAQVQVYQPVKEKVLIRIVKGAEKEINTDELISQFKEVLGEKISVAVEYVHEIPRDPSGKYSYVKSEVSFI